jgi:transposase InsO family protein
MNFKSLVPKSYHIPSDVSLSRSAKKRLKWMDHYHKHNNASLTSRYFGISRTTFYKWLNRYDPNNLYSLENRSCRPHNVRSPSTAQHIVDMIVKIRKKYMKWSKYKIRRILKRFYDIVISASTIGRVIKRYNLFPARPAKKRLRKRKRKRKQAPSSLKKQSPGSLLQFDTKHIKSSDGKKLYQFTAIDTCTRYRVMKVFKTACSRNAAEFLDYVYDNMPFDIENINTDNGSEFLGKFDDSLSDENCDVNHYFSRPYTPTDNAFVERSHKTDDDEFYNGVLLPDDFNELSAELTKWQDTYNDIRPHESLNYLTPSEYYETIQSGS